jgi:hypothetical protein
MDNLWYGLWAHELLKMAEPFNNLIIVPQYILWYTMPDDEPDDESIEEIDEDAVSEIGDEGDDLDEGGTHKSDDSDDELDILRDKDESMEPIEDQNPAAPSAEQDSDSSITESLFTIPDGSAPQLTPDFVALHILAKKLRFPTNTHLRHRYERRAGYRINHECCPLIMEIKSFPSRSLTPAMFERGLAIRLGFAKVELGFKCYYLFKRYQHALRTIAVIASGDHWTHLIVSRSDVPRGAGDEMNTETWDSLQFPDAVILGTPASDLRMEKISDYMRHTKPDLPTN